MIRLRPHHLLCILNYVGKGYSKAFVENYDALVGRMNTGERTVKIVRGPDDICEPLKHGPAEDYHCEDEGPQNRDDKALEALNALNLPDMPLFDYGQSLEFTPEWITTMRDAFREGQVRSTCTGCQWYDLCTDVSRNGYQTVKLW